MPAADNKATIERLYAAFAECNGAAMTACYAPGAHFRDPAFGDLEGDDIGAMWRMLTGRAKDLKIELHEHEWAKQALGPGGHLVALLSPLRSKARAKALSQLETYKREETGSSL